MSHFKLYYPECSQNEQKKIRKENEIIQERLLLARIDRLPDLLQRFIGEFSPVVAKQAVLVKYEFFDKWIIENTERIMALMDAWPKHHVAFVLNSIIRLEERDGYVGDLKGEYGSENHTAEYMRSLIKVYISYRNKHPHTHINYKVKNTSGYRYDLLIKYMINCHRYIPCMVNPAFNRYSSIRVYGAYKAIEEYDTRIQMKKAKKGKTLK